MKNKDVWYYVQGNVRSFLYYNFDWLLPKHIREQINFRINSMDRTCYAQGSCIMCGCETTALQMANKACDKPCYPHMMPRKYWNYFRDTSIVDLYDETREGIVWRLDLENKKFILRE
jgi:hypothetical protein